VNVSILTSLLSSASHQELKYRDHDERPGCSIPANLSITKPRVSARRLICVAVVSCGRPRPTQAGHQVHGSSRFT
jgi:hypothetical protein